jgi:hypothetical protein
MVGKLRLSVRAMVLNATLNNISAISWWLVLLEEEIGVPGEIKFTIKFVSDLRQVGGFLWVLPFPPPINLTATI